MMPPEKRSPLYTTAVSEQAVSAREFLLPTDGSDPPLATNSPQSRAARIRERWNPAAYGGECLCGRTTQLFCLTENQNPL